MSLNLDDPAEVALAAAEAFGRAGLEIALYGGLALATYGEPRETRDADLAVATVTVEAGQAALEAAGIRGIIAFAAVRFGGVSIGRISLVGGGKLNTIDLVTPRSARYASLVLTRAMRGTLDGQELRVVAPEDFILLKVLSTREQDLIDARTVLDALRERLDWSLLAVECELLATEIPDHDVRGRYDLAVRASV
jgi:hypothetical protein